MNRFSVFLFLGLTMVGCLCSRAGKAADAPPMHAADTTGCPFVQVEVERLADLNVPRSGHCLFRVGDEVVAVGGHTTGFVPTATAEYYSEGKWNLVPTVYEHDNGFCAPLPTGGFIIGGGHEKHLGIGQTFVVERYNPAEHSFEGFGCLDQKRALASATTMADGRVVIAGNWYADDAIEVFDGEQTFSFSRSVASPRPTPYILPLPDGDALVFGPVYRDGHVQPCDTVDRLLDEPFTVPLLREWMPLCLDTPRCPTTSSYGGNHYLLFALNEAGEGAFIEVCDTAFSLLPTRCPVPAQTPSGDSLRYVSPALVDTLAHRAYVMAIDGVSSRLYVLSVGYDQGDALGCPLTLCYTEPLPEASPSTPLLTPAGDLLLVGGIRNSNFRPFSSVHLLRIGASVSGNSSTVASHHRFPLWLLCLVLFLLLVAMGWWWHRRKASADAADVQAGTAESARPAEGVVAYPDDLLERIRRLMEVQQLFLNPVLKLSDVAHRLGTNSRYVSDCINTQCNCSFTHFVNVYRVEYAKQLILQRPDEKLSSICTEAGFTNETTFFRSFRAVTGMTPNSWRQQNGSPSA